MPLPWERRHNSDPRVEPRCGARNLALCKAFGRGPAEMTSLLPMTIQVVSERARLAAAHQCARHDHTPRRGIRGAGLARVGSMSVACVLLFYSAGTSGALSPLDASVPCLRVRGGSGAPGAPGWGALRQ